ncbi:hypothetical protein SETIT_5G470900v2 [Setaria italica]|uniref:Uncharacterized protein n=1 Tax=Setaria italica TaxID=4555 RepID=A0A368RI78_SETIT|nr:hypothetical protein SETIT_5G470900v2 [Setaria italica]
MARWWEMQHRMMVEQPLVPSSFYGSSSTAYALETEKSEAEKKKGKKRGAMKPKALAVAAASPAEISFGVPSDDSKSPSPATKKKKAELLETTTADAEWLKMEIRWRSRRSQSCRYQHHFAQSSKQRRAHCEYDHGVIHCWKFVCTLLNSVPMPRRPGREAVTEDELSLQDAGVRTHVEGRTASTTSVQAGSESGLVVGPKGWI